MSWVPLEIISLIGGAIAGYFIARSTRPSLRHVETPTLAEPPAVRDDPLEQLLRGLPIAAFLVDRGGRLAVVNDAAASLFSIDPKRASGRSLIEAISSVELERLVRRALAGENAYGTIAFRKFAAGVTIGINALPVAGDRGVLVIGEDRTEVAAVEHVRREFLADVSHELRTPISAIRLMIETIQLSGGDPEAIAIFLPKIATELERMTNLVEDLLDLARSESGQVALERSKVQLRSLVAEAVEGFRPRAESLNVELTLEPGPAIEAEVDPERVVQVVVNLVDNALRHTPSGGHVRVTLERRGGEAVIEVRDDGVGIPFKDLPHVFERFYVVDRSRARGSSGTGLGLAIVKQIVEAHGGEVRADSELGSGATFTCRLPLPQDAQRSLNAS